MARRRKWREDEKRVEGCRGERGVVQIGLKTVNQRQC
jgi:hypothetical protein